MYTYVIYIYIYIYTLNVMYENVNILRYMIVYHAP